MNETLRISFAQFDRQEEARRQAEEKRRRLEEEVRRQAEEAQRKAEEEVRRIVGLGLVFLTSNNIVSHLCLV